MSVALFISLDELRKSTAISGNIDADKLVPSLRTAQLIELEDILGTDLYNKMSADIIADTLTGDYLTLKQNYIHDFLIHTALYFYLPFATFQITNGGVSKWDGGENHTTIGVEDLTLLINKEKQYAETFKKRLQRHLCSNTTLYPELSTNTGEKISPNKKNNLGGWYMAK